MEMINELGERAEELNVFFATYFLTYAIPTLTFACGAWAGVIVAIGITLLGSSAGIIRLGEEIVFVKKTDATLRFIYALTGFLLFVAPTAVLARWLQAPDWVWSILYGAFSGCFGWLMTILRGFSDKRD